METNKQNISNRAKNESFGLSLVKIVLISALIVFGGALFGAIMFLAVNYSSPIKIAESVRPQQKETIKSEAQKYLPKDYEVVSDSFLYFEDTDNDKNKEIAVAAESADNTKESIFILKKNILDYSVAKEFIPDSAQYFQDMSVKDINNDNVPEIIYVTAMGAGESMPRTMKIYEWADGDYKLLVSKTMTAPLAGRPKIKGWIKDFVRDLNYDGQFEIIVPDLGVYQAFCGNSGNCLSLLNYEVYKWDGEKYTEATGEFLKVYDEDIKLANEILDNPKTSEENKKAIEKYLEKIENAKTVSAWKVYRNEEYGFEVKYPSDYNLSESEPKNKDNNSYYYTTRLTIDDSSMIEIKTSHRKPEEFDLVYNDPEYKKMEINNYKAFQYEGVGQEYFDIVKILGDKYLYTIQYSDARVDYDQVYPNFTGHVKKENKQIVDKNIQIFDQVLSTFKFIK